MNRSITLLAGTLALVLTACNADRNADAPSGETGPRSGATDDPSTGHPDTTGDAAVGDATAPGAMTGTAGADTGASAMGSGVAAADRKALMSVMEVDRHEIASAESALAKGVGEEARRYAETLRDEHTRNLETTSSLLGGPAAGAATGGQGADALPSEPEVAAMRRDHESERQRLEVLQGDAFESAWIDAMAKGHEKALGMLDSQLLPGASDDRVRRHLQSTREAIARHLETAKSLQSGR